MAANTKTYPANWAEISARVKRMARYSCEQCQKEFGEDSIASPGLLDVHHIDGDKANNSDFNLVALCRRCHSLIERVFVVWDYYMGVETDVSWDVRMWFDEIFPWAAKRGYRLSSTNMIMPRRTPISPAQRLLVDIFGRWEFDMPWLDDDQQSQLGVEVNRIFAQLKYEEEGAIRLHYGIDDGLLSEFEVWALSRNKQQLGRYRKKALRKFRHPIRSHMLRDFVVRE